ncbi:two-component response regulator-like APRR5 [Cajanus cajan]|uniref:two-component response regulator-like APRR5 n=1 Tax=Cajanus cajan TaxID=3821 RepID=UPI0010FB153C|nr:two-component response regulator-like APRR5 [Cajanus cajan]
MYTHNPTAPPRAADPLLSPPMQYGGAHTPAAEWTWQVNSEASWNCNTCNSCSSGSGCTSYMGSPSSLASYESQRACLMQRSVSSHSLQKNSNTLFSSPLFAQLLHSDNAPVRRACSTGDLQRFNGMQHYLHSHSDSPLSSESSLIIEEMSRTSPYSPEEKKVRIERYRSKRNQRNFGKKIKYACRKTLADSRPRIRGRFARNDEIAMNPPVQWSHMANGEEEDEEEENWANFFDSLVPENLPQDPQGSSSFGVFY